MKKQKKQKPCPIAEAFRLTFQDDFKRQLQKQTNLSEFIDKLVKDKKLTPEK